MVHYPVICSCCRVIKRFISVEHWSRTRRRPKTVKYVIDKYHIPPEIANQIRRSIQAGDNQSICIYLFEQMVCQHQEGHHTDNIGYEQRRSDDKKRIEQVD
jgi:hypothetical protein